MYYSVIGILAAIILLIENYDILFTRNEAFNKPSWKAYRLFLAAVFVYYVTDIIWGIFESLKLPVLLFADTVIYFGAMAAGILLWTEYTVRYLNEKNLFCNILVFAGRSIAAATTLLSVINIFYPVLFTVDDACVYRPLIARHIILVCQIILLINCSLYSVSAVLRHTKMPRDISKYRTLYLFGAIMAACLVIQLWFPYLPLYSIAYLLGTCLLRTLVIGDEKEEYRLELKERHTRQRIKEEHIAYARLNALAGDYICVYVVDPESGQYREFSAIDSYRVFDLPKGGPDFFSRARQDAYDHIYKEDLDDYLALCDKDIILSEVRKHGEFSFSYRLVIDGRPTYVRLKMAMVHEEEGDRLIVGINNIDASVRQEQAYAKRLEKAQNDANVDIMTGVKNRHAFSETVDNMDIQIKDGKLSEFAIVILDVNNLKYINDTEGHQAGDRYICNACRIICNTFKHSPVYRIGGDEFAVIVKNNDYSNIYSLLGAIDDHNEKASRNGGIVLACGMAKYSAGLRVTNVFENADHNMYENKDRLKRNDFSGIAYN